MIIKGLLIDPAAGSIQETTVRKSVLQDIYKAIDADLFECVDLNENNTIYVDEEGLLNGKGKDPSNVFTVTTGRSVYGLVGKALVLGHNEEGDSVDVSITKEQLEQMIVFHNIQVTG